MLQRKRKTRREFPLLACLASVLALPALGAPRPPADLVVTDARIYTEDAHHSEQQALAVRGGKIVFVGSSAAARRWIGPHTRLEKLGGRLVLPGLFDSHMHPMLAIKLDVCDLDSAPMSLRQISQFVSRCVRHYKVPAGGWLSVQQWNFSDGNQPDAQYPTLRAALDRASTSVAIHLYGNDGHHDAFNSAALARARNAAGQTVGLSKATLARDFSAYAKVVGVDADGEPNGAVNEAARMLIPAPGVDVAGNFVDGAAIMKARDQIPKLVNADGITGFLDAAVPAELVPVYAALEREGKLTARVTLAQFYDPDFIKTADGTPDFARMLANAQRIRAQYAHDPLIRANQVKLFADGVMEGNPYAVPPTLPDVLSRHPYLQPVFGKDAAGKLTVKGYVDTASALCRQVRAHPARYVSAQEVGSFMAAHGFHPAQCALSQGQLQHDPAVIREFITRFHKAGFTLHIHVIGDGTLHTVLDDLEAARATDGVSNEGDGIAHVQLAAPADVARLGRDHLFVIFTYAWAYTDPEYDMTVVPFIDHVTGNGYTALHPPDGYYERNAYPFREALQAGATLVAGSDAPVDTRDPRPFVNMALAVTRRHPGEPALNPKQTISIRDVLDAYTINGARFLRRGAVAGSLEAGKSADFIVLDRDILRLAGDGRADDIAGTRVLETWFEGRRVFLRGAAGVKDVMNHEGVTS
jgi:predicted amidohydrolase YtcJ